MIVFKLFQTVQINYLKLKILISRIAYYKAVSTDDTVFIFTAYDQYDTKAIHKFHNMEWTTSIGRVHHATYSRSVIRIGNHVLIVGSEQL